MYKLLAVDMDGTLLNSNRVISEVNKEAIKRAIEKGVNVVITSGRALKGVDAFLKEVNLVGKNQYLIANNGGTIYRTSDFKCIFYKGLSGKDLIKARDLSRKLGLNMIAYTHEGTIAEEENEFTIFEREYVGNPVEIIDFDSDIQAGDEITKILFSQTEEILSKKMSEFPKEFCGEYNLVKTMPTVLEVMDKDCNKGYGVKILADKLGIKKEEIICIGDQANDVEMITYAGLGVAMGNAIQELKDIAQYVTSDNDNDGVAEVIEKFIL
ncbi:Cof-type HAD-IIB family hydrolase [Inconstantimicrobium mannanitabidum]|uniref:Haloacid dehalogenase n=1 Tax=Inconstantimicrobium mannanitabidum TaxID=1604901 RepID=A0ACB5RIG5_9CLOT|nr:Cof-type HAD-IIB family hydrolase [Clostridium sp. TW13]GKX68877.1 haloacid dehalogenase [Clostridium sp. TW13]